MSLEEMILEIIRYSELTIFLFSPYFTCFLVLHVIGFPSVVFGIGILYEMFYLPQGHEDVFFKKIYSLF